MTYSLPVSFDQIPKGSKQPLRDRYAGEQTMRLSGNPNLWAGVRLAPVLGLALLLAGCTNKDITKANYDKIKDGMTLKQVEAIIGPPDVGVQGSGCRGCSRLERPPADKR
jgi:hypothetical protein